jgi:hypothetical protein
LAIDGNIHKGALEERYFHEDSRVFLHFHVLQLNKCKQKKNVLGSRSFPSFDTPPNYSQDSNASLKVKTTKEEGIGMYSLTRSTSRIRRECSIYRIGTRTSDKWVSYSHELTQTKQHID